MTGNLTVIRAAAAELTSINLRDALDICLLVSDAELELFERAALPWLARYALEVRARTSRALSRRSTPSPGSTATVKRPWRHCDACRGCRDCLGRRAAASARTDAA